MKPSPTTQPFLTSPEAGIWICCRKFSLKGKCPELRELLNAQSSWLKVVEELSPLRLANTEGLHDPSQARQIKAEMEVKARFRVKDPEP
jgi:hypothetical protein